MRAGFTGYWQVRAGALEGCDGKSLLPSLIHECGFQPWNIQPLSRSQTLENSRLINSLKTPPLSVMDSHFKANAMTMAVSTSSSPPTTCTQWTKCTPVLHMLFEEPSAQSGGQSGRLARIQKHCHFQEDRPEASFPETSAKLHLTRPSS